MKVLRDGKTLTLTARVVEREPAKLASRGKGGDEGDGESGFGMTLSPVTPQIARQLELPASSSGVVVTGVEPDSVAASAGIRPGDLIKRVNGKDVASIDSVRSALTAQGSGKPALVQSTGFESKLPTGRGLLRFSTLDEAIAGIREINRNYAMHSQAARQIAEQHFDANIVLRGMLARAGVSVAPPAKNGLPEESTTRNVA